MEIIITEEQKCDVIKIIGRIDSYTTPNIKDSIQNLINDGHTNLVMELSSVNYLSSSGILMFVNFHKQLLKNKNGKLVFSNVPELIYSNIKLAGFDKLFQFADDIAAAIDCF
ncbi:MAG: STAS domain-containing protein [Brevefilum sp.]|nr:STAS domain-containing protein [Brevefilum sp.]MDT8381192.1 STAS domain-containing protein [Brevefilum sp.]MDW7754421.1 STAS domain-containing protein [Brevefilum sp.]